MTFNEVAAKYLFNAAEAAQVFDSALSCSTQLGSTDQVISLLELMAHEDGVGRILKMVDTHAWTMENVADMVERLANLVDVFTFEGLMARISPLVRGLDIQPMTDGRRPCLVNNRKHWFLRWQTRKWICDPSSMVGGHGGGQCEVTMAIVEDEKTGQVAEVYPREVRFLGSV